MSSPNASTDSPTPNWSDAIRKRCERLRRVAADPAAQRREFRRCAASVSYWVSCWGWTFDPRLAISLIPFDLFARQKEFFAWLAERETNQENGLVEKSRDMGLTWLCCAYALHGWLFRDKYSVGFGSRKLELVDKLGDPDSILEKIRILLDYLPGWLLPRGYDRDKHALHCRIINPENGATITGEGGTEIGRGGRKSLYFVDEAAFLESPEAIERSLSQTTNCRIDVSTPNGPGNVFAQKRHSGKVQVFTMHWRDDPRKSDAWYASMKARFDPVTIAQELDIDYTASIEGITIPAAWVRAAVGLKLPMGKVNTAGLDIAEMGKDLTVLIIRSGPVVFSPIWWSQMNTTQTAHRAGEYLAKQEAVSVYYEVNGVGTGVRGTWDSSEKPLPFKPVAINTGEAPTDTVWPDGRTSKELFLNRRAELWWLLRARFERTFEYVTQGIEHPPEDMISLPANSQDLISELSTPLNFRTATGKIKIESKEDLARRGVKSPNFADALVLAFHPDRTLPKGSWRMENL